MLAPPQRVIPAVEALRSRGERLRRAGITWPLAWMGLLALVILWTRLVGIDQSFQQDEAYTVQYYLIPGPDGFLSRAYNPNNHLLFSWLGWLTTSALGQSEPLDRLWGVIPGMAAIGLLGWWVWKRLGPWTAVITVFLMAIAPLNLEFVKQARGYGLASLAFVLMLIASDRALRDPSRRAFAAWGVAGFIGVATHLVFSITFVGSAIALALAVPARRTIAIVFGLVTIACLLFYAPLLDGLLDTTLKYSMQPLPGRAYFASLDLHGLIAATPAIPTVPWHGPVSGAGLLSAREVELLMTGDVRATCQGNCFQGSDFVRFALPGLVLAALGAAALWRSHGWRLVVILAVPMLVTFTPLAVTGALVADRFLLHLLPVAAVLMAAAIAAIASAVGRVRPLRPVLVVLGSLLALFGVTRILDLTSRWTATPYENTKLVAQVANGSGIRPVVTNSDRSAGIRFYVGADLEVRQIADLEALFCDRRASFTYIDYPVRSDRPNTDCLYQRGAARVHVTQRGRGRFTDVWVVPPRS